MTREYCCGVRKTQEWDHSLAVNFLSNSLLNHMHRSSVEIRLNNY